MIVSRAAELARLDALLTALTRGEGGALVLHGEAGIGKTTLLDTRAERGDGAVTVVRACGAETEAELAFSALADLLEPVLGRLDALPVPQAAALTWRWRWSRPRQVTAWRCASPRSACCGPRP